MYIPIWLITGYFTSLPDEKEQFSGRKMSGYIFEDVRRVIPIRNSIHLVGIVVEEFI